MTSLSVIFERIQRKMEISPPPSCLGACDAAMGSIIPGEFHQSPCPVWKRLTLHSLQSRGVPERAARLVVSGLRQTTALERIAFYEGHEMRHGKALVLAGLPGTGKTVAATSILIHNDGLMVSAADLQKRFLDDAELSKLKLKKILIIDDIGAEHRGDFSWLVLTGCSMSVIQTTAPRFSPLTYPRRILNPSMGNELFPDCESGERSSAYGARTCEEKIKEVINHNVDFKQQEYVR